MTEVGKGHAPIQGQALNPDAVATAGDWRRNEEEDRLIVVRSGQRVSCCFFKVLSFLMLTPGLCVLADSLCIWFCCLDKFDAVLFFFVLFV